MDKSKIARQKIDRSPQISSAAAEDDSVIMSKIRSIIGRGNNAEVNGKKDGSLTVMEVKKNIV